MSKTFEKKIHHSDSVWSTLKKATTKNSDWPNKVRQIKYLYFVYLFLCAGNMLPCVGNILILMVINVSLRMSF